jgi:DNA-binding NarL/FixJ family response regulator
VQGDAARGVADRAIGSSRPATGLLSPSITGRLVEDFAAGTDPLEPPAALEQLTPRGREVLVLVARGLSNAEIAEGLALTDASVGSHVGGVLFRLGLGDRVQAVFAYVHGIVVAGDRADGALS